MRLPTLTMLFLFSCLPEAFAHGVSVVEVHEGIGLELHYDDGSALSFSETKVFAPDSGETPFQEGLTDRNGRFVFFPDSEGEWRIVANDGLGHGMVYTMTIDKNWIQTKKVEAGFSRYQKIVMGCSVIFGLTGFVFFLTARRERRG